METASTPKVYMETYGCQMNVADSELVWSLLKAQGYQYTTHYQQADVILVNTCAVRDNAEQRVLGRLDLFHSHKRTHKHVQLGVIGCMAERLGEELLQLGKGVDIVAGPDAYRQLPVMLTQALHEGPIADVRLSKTETYSDICPERLDNSGVSAFVSIMRGCNNFCTYCIVPYTRGRERSRPANSILREVSTLQQQGYKELTVLGQNVNSYTYKTGDTTLGFPQLLAAIAERAPEMRLRFTTSHPKDLSDELLAVMAQYPSIARHIHLPLQSGSNAVLKKMNRGYTREYYGQRVEAIRQYLPEVSITTDIFAGFCSETEADHQQTLDMMQQVQYDSAFMFKYSQRPGTHAARFFTDDVPEEVKSRRLQELIALQRELSEQSNQADVGKVFTVLTEGVSKKSDAQMVGRNSQNKAVVFPRRQHQPGDFVQVKITGYTSATLQAEIYPGDWV